MKSIIFILALVASNVASADIGPEDIFGGILDIIQDQIHKDHDNDHDFEYGPGVLLKDLGQNRLALGRIVLDSNNQMDSFVLPKCNTSPNEPVSALRFRVAGTDVFVQRVRITYQNGDQENVDVNKTYQSGTNSDWYQVDTGSRCVKSIVVRGEPMNDTGFGGGGDFDLGPISGFKKPQFPGGQHPGWGGPGGQGPGWGGPGGHVPDWGGPDHNPPGWGHPPVIEMQPSVLTFIGLIVDDNGF